MPEANPSHIMQVGLGFWASKTLLSAIELELFTHLAKQPMTGPQIEEKLGLHERATYDFLDTLVALKFLDREGNGESARYSNTGDTRLFLDKDGQSYIGGILEMANNRLYGFWGDLTEALQTGKSQNEEKLTGKLIFDAIYADPVELERFVHAMAGISMGNFSAFAQKFDFSNTKTMCDVGGAGGQFSIFCARQNEHLTCTSFDLPPVEPVAKRTIEAAGMSDRVKTASGDFFNDPLPKADLIVMAMILHDWGLEQKIQLIKKAFDALPEGGAFAAIEHLIDDDRRENAFGLMMSLNMLIETSGGFDYTGADFDGWCKEVGFKRTEVIHLAGPASAAVAYK